MALDRRLSRNFSLHEFPGFERATEADAAAAAETAALVLQPIRSHFGLPVRVTSWKWWSDGTPRTGSHAHGAVDFVVDGGRTRQAFEWAAAELVPAGYIGRLIYEPAREGAKPQGEHVHMAPRTAMVAAFNDPTIQVLTEGAEGEYSFFRTAASAGAAAVLAALIFLLARRPGPATS